MALYPGTSAASATEANAVSFAVAGGAGVSPSDSFAHKPGKMIRRP
jgi:hypothetical protein